MAHLPARNLLCSRPHPDPACARKSLFSVLLHAARRGCSPPAPEGQLSGLFVAAGRNSQKVSALVHVVSVERTFENVPWSSGQSFLIFLYIFACSVGCRPWLPAHPPSFAPCLRASGRACMHAQLLSRCVLHRGRKERRSLGAEPMGRRSTSSSLRTMVLHGTTPWLHFIARNATG